MSTQSTSNAPARPVASPSLPQRRDGEKLNPVDDLVEYAREYAREQPEMAALWCLGLGFVLGWKLRPW